MGVNTKVCGSTGTSASLTVVAVAQRDGVVVSRVVWVGATASKSQVQGPRVESNVRTLRFQGLKAGRFEQARVKLALPPHRVEARHEEREVVRLGSALQGQQAHIECFPPLLLFKISIAAVISKI